MPNRFTHYYELADQAGHRYRLVNEQLQSLPSCLTFMRLVVEGDMSCRTTRWRRNGRVIDGPTELAQHCERLHGYSQLFSRHHTFHPYVKHFLREYREHPIRHLDGVTRDSFIETDAGVREVFEDFVLTLRTEAKKFGLRKRAADWRGKFDKNADRLISLMGHVGERSRDLTVIELELDYFASRLTPGEKLEIVEAASQCTQAEFDAYWGGWSLDHVEPAPVKVPFAEVQRDRGHLLENMKDKPKLFGCPSAYVWRVQFTPVAGYSLRLSSIFEGTVGDYADLGREIGQYWVDEITQGRGRFRELESWPAIDTARRIAALDNNDATARANLRRVLMGDFGGPLLAVQALPYPGCHLFGTGLGRRQAVTQQRGLPLA